MTTRFAIYQPRLPDELLSSWLVRLALARGCDPLVLTSHLWPHRRVWTTDLDRGTIGSPGSSSGLSNDDFAALTLATIAPKVASVTTAGTPVWPWILAAGCRNRIRYGGLQFCPACLASDTRPYYRRRWRLAWHTGCPAHDRALIDHCPACGTVLEPHRLTLKDAHIALCAHCKADLRDQPHGPWSSHAARFQKIADHAVERGTANYGDIAIPATEWFRLARVIVRMLRAAGRPGHQSIARLFAGLGLDVSTIRSPATGLPLELLPTSDRSALLAFASQILALRPGALADAAVSTGLTRSALMAVGGDLPQCLNQLVSVLPLGESLRQRKLPRKRHRPRPRAAVEQMVARLQRKLRS